MKKLYYLIIFLGLWGCQNQSEHGYLDSRLSFEERAKDLITRMTLEEKVMQLCYEAPAIARLGLPQYNWWNECLHGVARAGIATVFPQPIGIAASFDSAMMYKIGHAISDEARAKYNNYVSHGQRGIYQGLTFWSPNINLFRDPRWGRGMETYGEDPYLTGELGVAFVKGLQGNDRKYLKTVATVKHFVVHSGPEDGRHSFKAETSDRDFYETYSPHFKKVIQEGNVYSVMCAYNRFREEACCGSRFLDSILRNDWGFQGYIVSDCGAIDDIYKKGTHELVATEEEAAVLGIRGGTDLCCGGAYKSLKSAVDKGLITEQEIDESVMRLMIARMKLGLYAPKNDVVYDNIPYDVVDCEHHRALALEAAQKSLVLLKNENQLLPLSKEIKKIAIIGPNADAVDLLLGNYNGYPSFAKTIYQGIKEKLPHAQIEYVAGCQIAENIPLFEAVPAKYLHFDKALKEKGVKVEIYNTSHFHETPISELKELTYNTDWLSGKKYDSLKLSDYAIRFTSYLKVPKDGYYSLSGEDFFGTRIYIDDKIITNKDTQFFLDHTKKYKIVIEYTKSPYDYPLIRLLWCRRNTKYKEEAIQVAKDADVIIYCMGISPHLEGEEMKVNVEGFSGGDRISITLPRLQTDLMQKIHSINKKSVLVLLNGSALSINWEKQNLPAILEAWYPGQDGGTAVADVLFGDYNPSGKLPITFYQSVEQIGDFHDYNMQGKTYRFFTGESLFRFGDGLSYTTFSYDNFRVKAENHTNESLQIKVDIKNTGNYDGEDIVQVYLSHPDSKYPLPIRSLKAFQRVHLKKGEVKTISFELNSEQLSVLNFENRFVVEQGRLLIAIGSNQPDKNSVVNKKVIEQTVFLKGPEYPVIQTKEK
ncbi:MAG: glycoside hydrolase family 3 C-terminal domain-containing protein [Prevotellaceae bacterium]|jgi:beta-glucosidase|nr:glycoside hydrolase family 3 C-terminal domain-containing protein [Prevotellaceae bacterium]